MTNRIKRGHSYGSRTSGHQCDTFNAQSIGRDFAWTTFAIETQPNPSTLCLAPHPQDPPIMTDASSALCSDAS